MLEALETDLPPLIQGNDFSIQDKLSRWLPPETFHQVRVLLGDIDAATRKKPDPAFADDSNSAKAIQLRLKQPGGVGKGGAG